MTTDTRAARCLLAGLVIGCLTFLAHEWLPLPWEVLGDSVATWVLVPFLAGRHVASLWRAAWYGLVVGLALNAGSYGALHLLTGRGDVASTVTYWVLAAALVSPVMGVAGTLSQRAHLLGAVLCALPGAVFVDEASPWNPRYIFTGPGSHALRTTWAIAGIVLTLALARAPRRWLPAAAALPVLVAAAALVGELAATAFLLR